MGPRIEVRKIPVEKAMALAMTDRLSVLKQVNLAKTASYINFSGKFHRVPEIVTTMFVMQRKIVMKKEQMISMKF